MTDQYRSQDRPANEAETSGARAPTDFVASNGSSHAQSAEPAVRQLDTIIDNLANYATPVLREIAARAAELAAKAGELAGPMAHKAADKTEQVGGRLATKGREVASDLRRETSVAKSPDGKPPLEPVETRVLTPLKFS